MPNYLFVCGTLRKAMLKTISPKIAALMQGLPFVGLGSVRGQLYDLGEYPGMIIGADFETRITGEVYELPEPQAILEVLDAYEGFIPGELEASLFARLQASVVLSDGQQLECWLYAYNDWVLNGRLIEGGDYVEYLQTR